MGATKLQKQGIAERDKYVRERIAFNQVEFAGLVGVHPITVSKWERAAAQPSEWQYALIDAIGGTHRERDILANYYRCGMASALALALEHFNR